MNLLYTDPTSLSLSPLLHLTFFMSFLAELALADVCKSAGLLIFHGIRKMGKEQAILYDFHIIIIITIMFCIKGETTHSKLYWHLQKSNILAASTTSVCLHYSFPTSFTMSTQCVCFQKKQYNSMVNALIKCIKLRIIWKTNSNMLFSLFFWPCYWNVQVFISTFFCTFI